MNPNRHLMTLDEFTIHQTRQFTHSTGELSTLLRDIGLACKFINKQVNKAGLVDILGAHGAVNVQGEEQMKLDIFANEVLINVLRNSSDCAGIASEENDTFVAFEDAHSINSKYVVMFDPLDGSSNIDVNASIGTIFCIYKRITPLGAPCTVDDFLQKGKNIMAAGYVIYGSSTMLVYATRLGVNGFTLEPSVGEFCLSHKDMKCPVDGKIYSINQGNSCKYDEKLLHFLNYCMEEDKETARPYSHRYIGSMVADLHRTLIKGGLFMYPSDSKNPNGKLRLLYECNPMSYIIEMAGGKGTAGETSILDIEPTELHQRVPIFIGSKNMVDRALSFIKG
ncbi:MAG: class 1 fructose-bisphosphatase [Bacteroidetes bacterium]|nr:class 1 fructose-bisphosphatase [Bacteroidota bacterium]MBP6315271.1 class 1 fructose-bisphosphatase [Chitinophagaceae bacterium]